jgi:hypothetical protein
MVRRLTLAIGILSASTIGMVGSAGANTSAPPAVSISVMGLHIKPGSQWTLSTEAVFQGGCTVVTFSAHPNQFADDIGDTGAWTESMTSVKLRFQLGPVGHPYDLSRGIFKGKYIKDPGYFSGSYTPKPRGGSSEASLTSGADPDC